MITTTLALLILGRGIVRAGISENIICVSSSPNVATIRLRIRKGENSKTVRAPINATAQQILSQYAGPGWWELWLCTSEGDTSLLPNTRFCDLNVAEPITLKIVPAEGARSSSEHAVFLPAPSTPISMEQPVGPTKLRKSSAAEGERLSPEVAKSQAVPETTLPRDSPQSQLDSYLTIRLRIQKGEQSKTVRAPLNLTVRQIFNQYAGPGSWDLQMCTSKGDKALPRDSRFCDLIVGNVTLKIVPASPSAEHEIPKSTPAPFAQQTSMKQPVGVTMLEKCFATGGASSERVIPPQSDSQSMPGNKLPRVSNSPVVATIQLRLCKGDRTKIIRAPINATAQQIVNQYAGPGLCELRLCASGGDEPLLPDTRFCDLNVAEPITLKILQDTVGEEECAMGSFNMQNHANQVQIFAIANQSDVSLLRSLARAAEQQVSDFDTTDLANTAWGFAMLGQWDGSLFRVLAAAAEQWLGNFKAQGLDKTAWSFATAGQSD